MFFWPFHGRAVDYVDSDWSIEILGFIIEMLEIDVWERFFLPNCRNFETFLFFKFLHLNSPKKILLSNKRLKRIFKVFVSRLGRKACRLSYVNNS